MSLTPGTAVADYQVVRKLGEGGMGEVYLAVHRTLGQRVVLKGLHQQFLGDAELHARLEREAEAMARLSHPNIVTIYNFLRTDDGAFIVMEYVEGTDFDTLIHRAGLLPPARAIELVLPILRALDYAHERGVIHRDLKPANLMVGLDGQVRVLDFGTAKLVDRPGLTRVGMTIGTATYMPPEQLLGLALTPATDIYAIGVTLYEMCTGRLPFESEDTGRLFHMIRNEAPVPPSAYYPGISSHLERSILKCLEKRPEDRFQSAGALASALETAAAALAAPRPPAPQPSLPKPAGAAVRSATPTPVRSAAPARPALAGIAAASGAGAGLAGVLAGAALIYLGNIGAGMAAVLIAAAVWTAATVRILGLLFADVSRAGEAPAPAASQPPPPALALDAPEQAARPVSADIGRRLARKSAPFDPLTAAAIGPAEEDSCNARTIVAPKVGVRRVMGSIGAGARS